MAKYYCEYCGLSFNSLSTLTNSKCAQHPNGSLKGFHKLYEGGEKSRYTCRYCGQQFSDLHHMVSCRCQRHPNGPAKGNHSPAL